MKRNRLYIIPLMLLMLWGITSCENESPVEQPAGTEAGSGITLKLSIPRPAASRAAEEPGEDALNENTIKTLDVFIYQEGADECLFYQHFSLAPELTGTGEHRETLNVEQEKFALNTNHTIFVVANSTETIPSTGLSLTQLKALPASTLDADKKQDAFAMDGQQTMVLNDGIIVNKEIPVILKRAAAKIRISLNYVNGYTPLENNIPYKKLVNYAADGAAIAQGTFVVSDLQSMSSFTEQNTGAGYNGQIILYSYANDWTKDTNRETYVLINVPVKNAEGTTTTQNYYRIPVNYRLPNGSTGQAESLYKLERNHLYDIQVNIDKKGDTDPHTAVTLDAAYTIQDWTTHEILVSVEGINFIYVKDTKISMPNSTQYTTTFQSSTPDVEISKITVNGVTVANGGKEVNIAATPNAKSGTISITSPLPENFLAKEITFQVKNGAGLTQDVAVSQYPALYIGSDISADAPGGSQGQNNTKMYIMNSFVADFSTLPDPDEFDEAFDSGFTHYAPDPVLGASYAAYIRNNAVLGYPLTDSDGASIDTEENNRRISPHMMLASQHGTTTAATYAASRIKCRDYVERDATTGETYSDWRMPTKAEIYMIDILQNVKVCEVKQILEGQYYWSADAESSVRFMDPRVGQGGNSGSLYASVRCVRDIR